MAKSKNGGTRAYIRGKIGSDVYSIGKDGKGKKQQVVRSLAEQVANPRTSSQMFGRMIMSTVMQAVSELSPIIDHSFDGQAKGQPSISEFIRRNYALVSADAKAHAASGNAFGLNKFGEKGAKVGAYIVSNGTVGKPEAVTAANGALSIALTADTLTVGGLKAALGLSADGYITYVAIAAGVGAVYCRAQLTTSLPDDTVIAAGNVESLFTFDGNVAPVVALSTNTIVMTMVDGGGKLADGVIISEKIDGAWKHSACTLSGTTGNDFASNVALPTYPVGSQLYLNGGDMNGSQSTEPEAPAYSISVTNIKVNNQDVSAIEPGMPEVVVEMTAGSKSGTITVAALPDEGTLELHDKDGKIADIDTTTKTFNVTVPNGSSNCLRVKLNGSTLYQSAWFGIDDAG